MLYILEKYFDNSFLIFYKNYYKIIESNSNGNNLSVENDLKLNSVMNYNSGN